MTDRARPGVVALYDIRPGNGVGQFLQPRSPHESNAPASWPFDLESGVWFTCDVSYLCANFSLPRPLCSRLRPDVCDRRETSDSIIAWCPLLGGRDIIKSRVETFWYWLIHVILEN